MSNNDWLAEIELTQQHSNWQNQSDDHMQQKSCGELGQRAGRGSKRRTYLLPLGRK